MLCYDPNYKTLLSPELEKQQSWNHSQIDTKPKVIRMISSPANTSNMTIQEGSLARSWTEPNGFSAPNLDCW